LDTGLANGAAMDAASYFGGKMERESVSGCLGRKEPTIEEDVATVERASYSSAVSLY